MEAIGKLTQENNNIIPENLVDYFNNLDIKPEEIKGDVLDVGAGNGELAEFLSKNKNIKITAVDEKPIKNGNIEILKADARNLPFENESFDLVISHACVPNVFLDLYSFEHPEHSESEIRSATEKAFNEIIRILKPKGEARLAPVLFAENYDSQKILGKSILAELDKLKAEDCDVVREFIRTDINEKNKEKTDLYRIIIKKV